MENNGKHYIDWRAGKYREVVITSLQVVLMKSFEGLSIAQKSESKVVIEF